METVVSALIVVYVLDEERRALGIQLRHLYQRLSGLLASYFYKGPEKAIMLAMTSWE